MNIFDESIFNEIMGPIARRVKPSVSGETQITFQGTDYFLIGDIETGGAIATKEQYEKGQVSFAHLYPNGDVKRHGKVIGNKNDITIMALSRRKP